jgi:hypothetical protein
MLRILSASINMPRVPHRSPKCNDASKDTTSLNTAKLDEEQSRSGKIQQNCQNTTEQTGTGQRATLLVPQNAVTVHGNAPLQATMSFDKVKLYRPNYVQNVPSSFVDVYNEFKGIGQYLDQPVVGGIEKLANMRVNSTDNRTWKNHISGLKRKLNMNVVHLVDFAEKSNQRGMDAVASVGLVHVLMVDFAEKSYQRRMEAVASVGVMHVLKEWDAQLAASGAFFWNFYERNLKPQKLPSVPQPTHLTPDGISHRESVAAVSNGERRIHTRINVDWLTNIVFYAANSWRIDQHASCPQAVCKVRPLKQGYHKFEYN